MTNVDLRFKELIKRIMEEGTYDKNPRPKYSDGVPAFTKYITQVFEEYDLSKGEFPITTLRPIAIKSAIGEMLWIYSDQTSEISVLENKYNITWWRDWDIGDGTIGKRYGATVKRYDLMNNLINGLKNDPFGRRHIINLLQEKDLKETKGLYPCAYETLWSVREVDGEMYLDMNLTMRSSDYLVAGLGINQMQYVALQMMVAHECGYKVGKFSRFTQNLHIYDRHEEQALELLKREPSKKNPRLVLNAEGKGFYDIKVEDFELLDYEPVKPQLQFDLGI